MSRENFINKLKAFNDSKIDKDESKLSEEQKEHLTPLFLKLDVKRISQITLNNNNCFKCFYNLDDDRLFYFFEVLTNTEKGLWAYNQEIENIKGVQRERNRNNALIKSIDKILCHAKDMGLHFSKWTLEDLEGMKQSLQNAHFTKRQLFQSLLFNVCLIMGSDKNTQKVSDVTNNIIKNYFDDDTSFTRDTDVTKFTGRSYNYGYLKNLILHHQ